MAAFFFPVFILSLTTLLTTESYEFGGFVKDLDVDIPFPPILDRRDGIPTGHLRPLGWQNRAEGPVHEESVTLAPQDFWDKYVNASKPMVIRGLVFGADAVEKWTDVYLNKLYGKLEVRVTQRVQRVSNENAQHMDLKKFLQNYRVEDWYLRLIMPQEMQAEVPMPYIVNCGPLVQNLGTLKSTPSKNASEQAEKSKLNEKLKKLSKFESLDKFELPKIGQLVEPYLWMSAGETSSLLHSHPEHNLHCVLDGRKDFILMPIEQFKEKAAKEKSNNQKKNQQTTPNPNSWRSMLDLHEPYPNSNEWYSKIDVDMVNAFKYSVLHESLWYWSSLRAGDCIYIPANYLHQIRSHGRGISSSVYFVNLQQDKELTELLKQEAFSQCPKNAPLYEKMNKFESHFLWTYTHGERHLNQRNIQGNDAKRYLLYLLHNDEALHFEKFKRFFDEIMHEIKESSKHLPSGNIAANIEPKMAKDDQNNDLVQLEATDVWNDFKTLNRTAEESSSSANTNQLKREDIAALDENVNLKRFIIVLNKSASYHDELAKKKAASGATEGREEL